MKSKYKVYPLNTSQQKSYKTLYNVYSVFSHTGAVNKNGVFSSWHYKTYWHYKAYTYII